MSSASYDIGDHKPTVVLSYYPPEGARIASIGRFSRKEYKPPSGSFAIFIGETNVVEKNGIYHLNLSQGAIKAKLEFNPQLPSWKVGSGNLFLNSSSGEYFNWIVPVPRAYVTGTIKINEEKRFVKGVGYHDHNWGNIYLRNIFKDWVWGRIWGGKYTLVFGDLTPQGDAPQILPLLLGCDNKVWGIPGVKRIQREYTKKDGCNRNNELRSISIESDQSSDVSLSLISLKPLSIVQIPSLRPSLVPWRKLAEPLFGFSHNIPIIGELLRTLMGKGLYKRWLAKGILRVGNEKIEVQGLVEEMELESGGKS